MDRSSLSGRAVPLLLALLAACGGGEAPAAPAGGMGRRLAPGEPRAMLPSADGAHLAWLDGCHVARGRLLPAGTASCELHVVASAGGAPQRVASAVTTLPHGFGWSPAGGALAAVGDYDYGTGSGTLVLWRDGKVTELARDVTFHGFGPGGELGFVSGGTLSVLHPGEAAPRPVADATGIASFDFSPAGEEGCGGAGRDRVRLLARRSRAGGGQLLAAGCRLDRATPVLERAGEYGFSPDGARFAGTSEGREGASLRVQPATLGAPAATLGRAVQRFAFARDGGALAFVGEVVPGSLGNLWLAEPGRPARRLAREVGELRWARGAPRIAWLEQYDPRVRSGVLGVGGPGIAARTWGRNVTDFDIAADGKAVAFLQHTTRGGYSVDLGLAAVDAPEGTPPAVVAHGVFGFAFSPDGRWLYYRTGCTRNGEACDLERVPAAGLAKDGRPEAIARGMKSFDFDPRDPSRLLIGWQRMDRPALDLGVWREGEMVRVDQLALPGSARFLGPDSGRLGYAVIDPKRAGVYVADLP